MSRYPIVPSTVKINGLPQSVALSPYVCEYGFWLQNHAGGWGGPHTEINVTPTELEQLLEGKNASFEQYLSLPNLGHIDECNGYAAADVGSHRRHIISVAMMIEPHSDSITFAFNGNTGFIDPAYVTHPNLELLSARGAYEFHISFSIPTNQLSTYIKDTKALNAVTQFVARSNSSAH